MKRLYLSIFILLWISLPDAVSQEYITAVVEKAKAVSEITILKHEELKTETINIRIHDNPELIKEIENAIEAEKSNGVVIKKIDNTSKLNNPWIDKSDMGAKYSFIAMRYKEGDKHISFVYLPMGISECTLLITTIGSMGKLNPVNFGEFKLND